MLKEKIKNQLKKILTFQEVNFYQVFLYLVIKLAHNLQIKQIKVDQIYQTQVLIPKQKKFL